MTEIIDGDTIRARFVSGTERTIRYIGIDTPEVGAYGGRPERCGKEATRANHGLVNGQKVRLRFDRDREDRYGRLLAYVYRSRDELFVNAELVRIGLARSLTVPPNTTFAPEFRRLERQAGPPSCGGA